MLTRVKKWKAADWFRFSVLVILAAIMIVITIFLSKWVLSLRNPDNQQWFQDVISSMGIGGWFVILAVQYIQIVLAFVPGGPIQVIAGVLYGPWGGMAVCIIGTILATGTVYYLVSKFGHRVLQFVIGEGDITKYKFLQNTEKLETLVVLLFFIPGTPKDALTYLFALTDLSMKRFMVLSTTARVPAVLTSVLAGKYIAQGRWIPVIVIFGILVLLGVLGFVLHKKILRHFEKSPNK